MSVEITVTMTVRDVVVVIDRRYGSVRKLRAHITKNPKDSSAVLLWDTATRFADEPDLVVHLSEVLLGDTAEVLTFGKLQLIGYLMGHPGIGVRELARSLAKNPATVFEQVAQLEKAGIVLKESRGPGRPAALRPLIQELTIRLTPEATA